jgi:hypothetical protein
MEHFAGIANATCKCNSCKCNLQMQVPFVELSFCSTLSRFKVPNFTASRFNALKPTRLVGLSRFKALNREIFQKFSVKFFHYSQKSKILDIN